MATPNKVGTIMGNIAAIAFGTSVSLVVLAAGVWLAAKMLGIDL